MICPEGRAEYVPGVTVCLDCGVDLVDALESAKIPLVIEGHTHAALFGPGPGAVTSRATRLDFGSQRGTRADHRGDSPDSALHGVPRLCGKLESQRMHDSPDCIGGRS